MKLVAALNATVRLASESLTEFGAQLKKLTPEDRAWFAKRFKLEYGWDITDI